MKNNFWENLQKPFFAMAPMAGVTDSAFRQMCVKFGSDVNYSEMASVAALVYDSKKTLEMLKFEKIERPYVVQLFGSDPDHFIKATRIITKEVNPDGIDINFGCPVKKIQKQGAGALLMKDFEKSYQIIKNVIDNTHLPVSIKTRTWVGDVHVLDFLKFIKDLDIKALMIHGRTLAQGFSGDIDIETIKKARNVFDGIIMANGGINNKEDADRVLADTGVDGIGIARGALGRPWIFSEVREGGNIPQTKKDVFKIALIHAKLVEKFKDRQGMIEMRKHLCWYVRGLEGASELRRKLIQVSSMEEIEKLLKDFY